MRAIPIPDHIAAALGGRRVIFGEPGDPTRDDVRPCEYLATPSQLYPHRYAYTALVELEPEERTAIAEDGAQIVLVLDGAEVPWALMAYIPPPPPDPDPPRETT